MAEWYFSEDDAQLICPERVVQLTTKAASVLACLHRNRNEIVSVEQFLGEVWPDAHVTPDLIREYVHDIRGALKDDARHPRFIETVRGKGFRLIGEIDLATEDLTTPTRAESRALLPTLAILKPPSSGDATLDTLAGEVVSEITNHLARFHYIGLIARVSPFNATEASDLRAYANDLDAKYLLDANYARLGGVIRARVQLLDAQSGQALWGTRLDIDGDDPSLCVDKVSQTVVMALTGWHGELHRAEYKSVLRKQGGDLNAFEHFILGCDLEMRLDAESLSKSIFHLDRSIQLDPTFARAWLVYALTLRWAFSVLPGRDKTYMKRAAKAFQTALNLAPTDPVNLALMAMNAARIGNPETAITMLERAEATMIGDSDAMVCVATAKAALTDDVGDALRIFDDVIASNSATPSWVHFVDACIAFMAGDYRRCIASYRSGPKEISASAFCCLSLAMLEENEPAKKMEAAIYAAYPKFDFNRLAANFPIVSSAVRKRFDEAVIRLKQIA